MRADDNQVGTRLAFQLQQRVHGVLLQEFDARAQLGIGIGHEVQEALCAITTGPRSKSERRKMDENQLPVGVPRQGAGHFKAVHRRGREVGGVQDGSRPPVTRGLFVPRRRGERRNGDSQQGAGAALPEARADSLAKQPCELPPFARS